MLCSEAWGVGGAGGELGCGVPTCSAQPRDAPQLLPQGVPVWFVCVLRGKVQEFTMHSYTRAGRKVRKTNIISIGRQTKPNRNSWGEREKVRKGTELPGRPRPGQFLVSPCVPGLSRLHTTSLLSI